MLQKWQKVWQKLNIWAKLLTKTKMWFSKQVFKFSGVEKMLIKVKSPDDLNQELRWWKNPPWTFKCSKSINTDASSREQTRKTQPFLVKISYIIILNSLWRIWTRTSSCFDSFQSFLDLRSPSQWIWSSSEPSGSSPPIRLSSGVSVFAASSRIVPGISNIPAAVSRRLFLQLGARNQEENQFSSKNLILLDSKPI